MKKFLCLMMTLVMLLCSVSALAEMAGGWMIPEDTGMTDEALEAFSTAAGEDAGLIPNAVMGTQVVAGINYAILTTAPACVEVAYVYHSASGDSQLVREQQLLSVGENVPGGWSRVAEEELDETAYKAVSAAFEDLTGIGVKAFCFLGQQVVAGMNYAVLCRKVTMTAEPVEGWAMATVYVDLEGNASVTDLQDVVLSLSEE